MSFVFRGSRADLESGFPGFIPEPPTMRIHTTRPVNTNSLAFLVTVILLFMILNSHQMSPNFLLWVVVGVFLMATSLRMYATCQQLQAEARAHAAAASGLLAHTELRLHMPPSIALATRGRLQGLRLQLALLDREFDDLDYDTLRALDSDNTSTNPSMSEEEINALPVHKYRVAGSEKSSPQQVSSSSGPAETKQDSRKADGSIKCPEDELTCSICLEQVDRGTAPDPFGLLGLLSVIRMSDPDLTSLALGIDLTTLGLNLNSTENLHKTFGSPWSDEPAKGDPEFTVPQCYYAKHPPALHQSYFSKFTVETLFYIFYSMPKDEAQLYAANELYNRGWFYHKEHRLWFIRVPNIEPLVKTNTYERGSYHCFDPNTFETIRKDNFVVHYEMLEKRPALPPH